MDGSSQWQDISFIRRYPSLNLTKLNVDCAWIHSQRYGISYTRIYISLHITTSKCEVLIEWIQAASGKKYLP